MSLDHQKAASIALAGEHVGDLAHIARNESLCGPYTKISALADYQILSIGTVEPTLRALSYTLLLQEQQSILACCDRPALFYLYGDRLEMQYLREDVVNQATIVLVKVQEGSQDDAAMEADKGLA